MVENKPLSLPLLSFSLRSTLGQFELQVEANFYQTVTGIFGVSGAGKTTILKCLAGLKKDVEGFITFNNIDWLNSQKNVFLPPERRNIGYVPQNGLLFPNKNVKENILIACQRQRAPKPKGNIEQSSLSLQSVCELLELDSLLGRNVSGLSGGERQRVALGRALCSQPDILLLDEPLAALDLQLKRQIMPYLYRIREEVKVPMIMISHQPAEIQALCDDVLVLKEGKNIAFGAVQKILLDSAVLKLTHGEHYENILPATVLAGPFPGDIPKSNSLLAIGETHQVQLITGKVKPNSGSRLMVGIPANDIIVATRKPEGLSAQNIIQVNITAIEAIDEKYLIHTLVLKTGIELHAEISAYSLTQLGIAIGDQVYLVIKSSTCIIYQ